MKYIRLTIGIFEVEEDFKPLKNDMVYIPNEGLNKIIAQADTIEELCDEYVIHYANGYHLITINNGDIIFKDDFDYGFKLKFALENNWEIYGSIWVDDNLIKVAKMNEKGEMELL